MLGDADLGAWNILLDDGVCFFMCAYEGEIGAKIFQKTFFLRWPHRLEIGMSRDDIGLIDRDPEFYLVSKCGYHFLGVAREVFGEARREYATFLGEPERECPVPQGDEGFDVSCSEGADDILIVCDFLLIPCFFCGFDTRPLDRETVGGVMETLCDIEVFFVAVVVIDGDAGNIVFGTGRFSAKLFRPMWEVREL